MKKLVLREAKIEDKEQILKMKQEIEQYDNNFEGLSNLSKINNYEEWLKITNIKKE